MVSETISVQAPYTFGRFAFDPESIALFDEGDPVQLGMIESGPHTIPWTHADQVNGALLEFLGSYERRNAGTQTQTITT